jgi:hypothetical protein
VRLTLAILLLAVAGCSKPAPTADSKQGTIEISGPATTVKHPYAKYIELAGFRLVESKPGEVEVKIAVVNHSEADLGDLDFNIRLRTSTSKPEDPPVGTLQVKVAGLGPLEIRDVSAKIPSKLRVYELPDWQFLRGDFDITSPAP